MVCMRLVAGQQRCMDEHGCNLTRVRRSLFEMLQCIVVHTASACTEEGPARPAPGGGAVSDRRMSSHDSRYKVQTFNMSYTTCLPLTRYVTVTACTAQWT